MKTRATLVALTGLMISGCVTTPLAPHAQSVTVTWDTRDVLNTCERRGTVIGSQGAWYNYWFISDRDLTQGALNQLRNQADLAGADTVSLYYPPAFDTSVTLIGNAFLCHKE
ncbi:DUF4156 domain-containing protein [Photobacterium japonica]|uniref:DUF4156 domain-containing protein n=1 Tax=Photobacterium japonica TaxID=2910235 RepID=UPI003D0A60FC